MRRLARYLIVFLLVLLPALATGFAQTAHAATSTDGETAAWTPNTTFQVVFNNCDSNFANCSYGNTHTYTLTSATTAANCTTTFQATGKDSDPNRTWTMNGTVSSSGTLSFTTVASGDITDTVTTQSGTVASDGSASGTATDTLGYYYQYTLAAGSFVAGSDCQDLTLTGGKTFTGTEGASSTGIVASASDPDRNNMTPLDFSITVDWGDGSTSSCTDGTANPCYGTGATSPQLVNCTQAGCDIQGTHTYADECPATSSFASTTASCPNAATGYTITVSMTDSDQVPTTSNPASVTSNAVISDASLTVAGPTSPQSCVTFSACNVSLGSFTDTNTSCNSENAGESTTQNGGSGAHYLVTVNGSTTGVTFTQVGTSCVFDVSYAAGTFTAPATPTYTFCVTDEGGSGPTCTSGATATTVTVGYTPNPHQPTSNYAPAQGSVIGQCSTNYPVTPTVISNCDAYGTPGGGFNMAGGNSVGIHWVGTRGSYAHFLCSVPSIVTGLAYATYTSSELDVATTSQDGYNNIQEWCQVQTSDRPATNLYATVNGLCINQSQNPPYESAAPGNSFTVTENTSGLVTLRCTFRTPRIT